MDVVFFLDKKGRNLKWSEGSVTKEEVGCGDDWRGTEGDVCAKDNKSLMEKLTGVQSNFSDL